LFELFEEFEMFKKLSLRGILLPEPAVPEFVEGQNFFQFNVRSLSLSKGAGSRLTLQTLQTLQTI
jgi:hypothetical protein